MPRGQPSCGSRGSRNSSAIRNTLPSSARHVLQQVALTSCAAVPCTWKERSMTGCPPGGVPQSRRAEGPGRRLRRRPQRHLLAGSEPRPPSASRDGHSHGPVGRRRVQLRAADRACSVGGAALSSACRAADAPTVAASRSQLARSASRAASAASRYRSATKMATAASVRYAGRPSTWRTTIGSLHAGQRGRVTAAGRQVAARWARSSRSRDARPSSAVGSTASSGKPSAVAAASSSGATSRSRPSSRRTRSMAATSGLSASRVPEAGAGRRADYDHLDFRLLLPTPFGWDS